MATSTKNNGASPKEKFEAAVNVIHGLPKQETAQSVRALLAGQEAIYTVGNIAKGRTITIRWESVQSVQALLSGKEVKYTVSNIPKGRTITVKCSFQPSHAMMLAFYAFYKQATIGPCNISKPAFWDVIGRAKWDAWNRLGDMSQELAMTKYVDELKKIIETMPHTDLVEGFVEKLGDFYELVDDEVETVGSIPNMIRNASPKYQQKRNGNISSDSELSEEGINHGAHMNGYHTESSDPSLNGSPIRVRTVLYMFEGGGNDNISDNDDDDEFCDTSEVSLAPDVIHSTGAAVRGVGEGGVEEGAGRINNRIAHTGEERRGRARTGDQVMGTLTRLQQDVESVTARLKTLETLSRDLSVQRHRDADERKRRARLFGNLSRPTVIFFLAWPFIAHFIIQYLSRRNTRHRRH